ncbi:MAG: TonB family protein [Desulfobacula sp.]|nr:TonB family protein [Desulfobacula sp.]
MSSGDKTYNSVFTQSGCLSLDGLKKYHDSLLTPEELKTAQKHIDQCNLCSDALEGFELINDDEKYTRIISEVNRNIYDRIRQKRKHPGIVRGISDRTFYMAVAATTVILLGISYLFYNSTYNSEPVLGDLQETVAEEENMVGMEMAETTEEDITSPEEERLVKKPPKSEEKITKSDVPEKSKAPLKGTGTQEENSFGAGPEEDIVDAIVEDKIIDEIPVTSLAEEHVEDNIVNSGAGYAAAPEAKEMELQDKQLREAELEESVVGAVMSRDKKGKAKNHSKGVRTEMANEEMVFTIVEQMPKFPGGEEALQAFLSENLRYPVEAREAEVSGKVFISFLISKKGKVKNVEVLRGIGYGCDKEAIRVVEEMPRWIPGRQRGKAVSVQFVLPIEFKLR